MLRRCTEGTDMESLFWRGESRWHASRHPRLALTLRALLFTSLMISTIMTPFKNFLHKPLSRTPQKCFLQSGPALAKAGPEIRNVAGMRMGMCKLIIAITELSKCVCSEYLVIYFCCYTVRSSLVDDSKFCHLLKCGIWPADSSSATDVIITLDGKN